MFKCQHLPYKDNKEFHGTVCDAVTEMEQGLPLVPHSANDDPETDGENHQTEDVRLTRLSLGRFKGHRLCKMEEE